jgi:hypothetical protein
LRATLQQFEIDSVAGNPCGEAPAIAPKKRKSRRWLIIWFISIVLTGWLTLLNPLPKPVLYFIVNHAGGWLINQGGDRYSGKSGAVKRLANVWLEHSVMAQLHERLQRPERSGDLALLQHRLQQIKPMLINQMDLPHDEILSSNALIGVGKCTGVNMAAAQLLVHDFDRVEMIAIDGDQPDGGHAYGRLWSPQYKNWLYFDIWTAQIQIFTATPGGAKYLWRYPAQLSPVEQQLVERAMPMHDAAMRGHLRLKLQDSFGGYIWYRFGNMIDHGTTWEKDTPVQTEPALASFNSKQSPEAAPIFAHDQSAQAATYLIARLDQFFGKDVSARKGYLQVSAAAGSPKGTFEIASKIFAGRLAKRNKVD